MEKASAPTWRPGSIKRRESSEISGDWIWWKWLEWMRDALQFLRYFYGNDVRCKHTISFYSQVLSWTRHYINVFSLMLVHVVFYEKLCYIWVPSFNSFNLKKIHKISEKMYSPSGIWTQHPWHSEQALYELRYNKTSFFKDVSLDVFQYFLTVSGW